MLTRDLQHDWISLLSKRPLDSYEKKKKISFFRFMPVFETSQPNQPTVKNYCDLDDLLAHGWRRDNRIYTVTVELSKKKCKKEYF